MTDQNSKLRDKWLRLIVRLTSRRHFRRQHLNRDVVAGIVGDRGDGKSLSMARIIIDDYMVQGEPCWSNMHITNINRPKEVTEEQAAAVERVMATAGVIFPIVELCQPYPAPVVYESKPLDIKRFLAFDSEYHDGIFAIDEINVWLADCRRSMAYQNLAGDDVIQQLRKLRSALWYTCIDERTIDGRIFDATDFYIKSMDQALVPENLVRRKPQGEDFSWTPYAMSRKLDGFRYQDTHQPLPTIYFHGKRSWGIIDTFQKQSRNAISKKDLVSTQAKYPKEKIDALAKYLYKADSDGLEAVFCEDVPRDVEEVRDDDPKIIGQIFHRVFGLTGKNTRRGNRSVTKYLLATLRLPEGVA